MADREIGWYYLSPALLHVVLEPAPLAFFSKHISFFTPHCHPLPCLIQKLHLLILSQPVSLLPCNINQH